MEELNNDHIAINDQKILTAIKLIGFIKIIEQMDFDEIKRPVANNIKNMVKIANDAFHNVIQPRFIIFPSVLKPSSLSQLYPIQYKETKKIEEPNAFNTKCKEKLDSIIELRININKGICKKVNVIEEAKEIEKEAEFIDKLNVEFLKKLCE